MASTTTYREFLAMPRERRAGIEPDEGALRVVIAGGAGALGRNIAADLTCRGHAVTILTRRVDPNLPFPQVVWDGRGLGDWVQTLREPGPVAVVNLAGKLVDCRPTERNIAELRSSRVDPTAALVAASHTLDRPVERWVQASTTAIWSDAGETRCTETTPLPVGLPQMTGVAEPWERASEGANATHRIVPRTSIVLDPDAPALKRLVQLTRAGLGGRIGRGEQWFSWIHLADWLTLVGAALGLEPEVRLPDGILVAATDHPVRNRELMAALRRHLRRPPAPPTPVGVLRLGAVLLRSDPALGLTGRHTSEILPSSGFRFRYPTLDEALTELLGGAVSGSRGTSG
ncbi:epimerase [Nocardia sp. NPDC003482]